MEKEELMRWKEKEKEDGTAREKWMNRQEHEVVMLNLSILAGKLSDEQLVEEKRTPTYGHDFEELGQETD
jgi:hypothetical protein